MGLREGLKRAAREAENDRRLAAIEGHYGNALNMLLSPKVRQAFDFSGESVALRDDYGRTKIGGRCLQARRLVEAGARFVMVDYGYDPDYGNLFDIHNAPSQNFPHVSKMVKRGYNVVGVDRAFAALIRDLEGRGLLDETLVVFLTEFGRTPKINKNGGRDHWGACGSIFFAGAGIESGQVVGQQQQARGVSHHQALRPGRHRRHDLSLAGDRHRGPGPRPGESSGVGAGPRQPDRGGAGLIGERVSDSPVDYLNRTERPTPAKKSSDARFSPWPARMSNCTSSLSSNVNPPLK